MDDLTPVEVILKRYESDQFGHKGNLSLEAEFFSKEPIPLNLPVRWAVWDEYMAQIPFWYRLGQVCENLVKLPMLDPAELDDAYLVRANMILGTLALGFQYCWTQMREEYRVANTQARALIKESGELLEPIRKQIIDPWQKIWLRMGRHRSCVESDLFTANYIHTGSEPYAPNKIRCNNARLMLPFFQSRTEHRFWFVVIELCARFPGISTTVNLQRAMQNKNHPQVIDILHNLASIWNSIVEEVLSAADIRVSAIEWGNTTARWSSALFAGEEGFSGLFAPAWHIMDRLTGRKEYGSFLGGVMTRTQKMLPVAWQEYIAAVGEVPLSQYIEAHKNENPKLGQAYKALLDAYHYFFRSHRRKVFAFEYQSMLSGRSETNGGISAQNGCPGWDKVNEHLIHSESERPSCPFGKAAIEITQLNPYLIQVPVINTDWLPGDKARLFIERENGARASLFVNFAPKQAHNNNLMLWSTEFKGIKTVFDIQRVSGEFSRPPKDQAPVIIMTDAHCAGMAAAIINSDTALNPVVWLEAENEELEGLFQAMLTRPAKIEFVKKISKKIINKSSEVYEAISLSNAHIYLLGSTDTVRYGITALKEAVGFQTLCVYDTFRILREQKRLHISVLYQKDSIKPTEGKLYPWNIVVMNNNRNVRVVLNDKVLNLTNFLPIHIGGENILMMMVGTDITKEFETAHPNGLQALGLPGVFIEADYVKMPDELQALTNYIYGVVRYVNAFVITQNDVMTNNREDSYVCANTLLHALEQWPREKIWGRELYQSLQINLAEGEKLAEFCNEKHQIIMDMIIKYMSTDAGVAEFKLLYHFYIKEYETFGRMLINILADILKGVYLENKTELSDTQKVAFIHKVEMLAENLLVNLLNQQAHTDKMQA